jgi:hypothetical protein
LNPLPQGLFIPRNLKSIFIQASVTQVSDVAHGPLVHKLSENHSLENSPWRGNRGYWWLKDYYLVFRRFLGLICG